MIHNQKRRLSRRGAIALLAAILLIPGLALLAFVLNLGYILVAKEELQKAADSAALAGASQLLTAQPSGNPNDDARARSDIAKVVSEAKTFCVSNAARGVNLTLLDSDIVAGYVASPTSPASPLIPWAAGQPYPNAVKVIVRRDSSANTPIPLFLARVLGMSTWSGRATATASTSRAYTVTGFNSPTLNAKLLPVAINITKWNTFLTNGKSPDGSVHDDYTATRPSSTVSAPHNVSAGSDNVPEYVDGPEWSCIGPPSNNVPTMRTWIDNGAAPSDMAYFGHNGLQVPANSAKVPGTKDTLMSNLQDAAGQPRVVMLYDTSTGGNYHIVGFAGVTIVGTAGNGSHHTVSLQPMVVIDPTATASGTSWSGTNRFVSPTSPLCLIR